MSIERVVRMFAGVVVLLSLALAVPSSPFFVSQGFFWLTAFVGANLLQSAFTRFCPLENILRKLGVGGSEAVST